MEEADVKIRIQRFLGVGQEVVGTMFVKQKIMDNGTELWEKFPTLENKNYLFNDGIYQIKYEASNRFKRKLWEFKGIQGRSEIKFHRGINWLQSRGCILLGDRGYNHLHRVLDPNKSYMVKVETFHPKKKKR